MWTRIFKYAALFLISNEKKVKSSFLKRANGPFAMYWEKNGALYPPRLRVQSDH